MGGMVWIAKVGLVGLLYLSAVGVSLAAGDAALGKKVFKKCMSCHQIGEGARNGVGPVLTGIVGRKAASYADYSYGKSLRKAAATGLVWDEDSIGEWLKNPKKFLRKVLGTRKVRARMRFKLKKQSDRDNVVAFLKTFAAMESSSSMDKSMPAKADDVPPMKIAKTDICVENSSGKKLLFVVEARGGERLMKTLTANQLLCTGEAITGKGGTVGVFVDEDALEGCSRLAAAGQAEKLIAYQPFDNCTWYGQKGG